mmetsp:Transcript_27944/g.43926  ORF Transcript_27944/g.43926 Transcript_27944/m.43926 type:complete len:247 (-) Transcript_27944:1233-1973(-)
MIVVIRKVVRMMTTMMIVPQVTLLPTVDHDHGGVKNPSHRKSHPSPRSHPHGGGEVEAVIMMMIRTTTPPLIVGGRNHHQNHLLGRIRLGGRRVVAVVLVGGIITARIVVVVEVTAATTATVEAAVIITRGPANESPRRRKGPPPVVRNPHPSHHHPASWILLLLLLLHPRLKCTTPAMPIRECAPSTPTYVYGENHVWEDGRMCYGSVPNVSRRRRWQKSRVIMQVVLVGCKSRVGVGWTSRKSQ